MTMFASVLQIFLIGLILTSSPSSAALLTEGSKLIVIFDSTWYPGDIDSPLVYTDRIINTPDNGYHPNALTIPESSTMAGVAVALVLNGLGLAGSRYYLRRKYNRESVGRYATRYTTQLPIFVDTMLSVVVILTVSPVLLTVAALGALKTGVPKVYRCTKTPTAPINKQFAGRDSV